MMPNAFAELLLVKVEQRLALCPRPAVLQSQDLEGLRFSEMAPVAEGMVVGKGQGWKTVGASLPWVQAEGWLLSSPHPVLCLPQRRVGEGSRGSSAPSGPSL